MRRFLDDSGAEWTVVLSNGSYGSVSLIFAATGEAGNLRWIAFEAASAAEGQELLKNQSDDELRERLAQAEDWNG
jgi:hypothetical protein